MRKKFSPGLGFKRGSPALGAGALPTEASRRTPKSSSPDPGVNFFSLGVRMGGPVGRAPVRTAGHPD